MNKSFYIILFMLCSVFLYSCTQKASSGNKEKEGHPPALRTDTLKNTEISVDHAFYDFGDIDDGVIINHSFRISNTGAYPLHIIRFQSSCDCTKVIFPEVIEPHGSKYIDISFNSSGKKGFQYKEIIIFANIEKKFFKLSFSAYIKQNN